MFFILLGIILSIGVIFIGEKQKWKDKIVSVVMACVFVGFFVAGLLIPVAGVQENAEIIELSTLSDGKFYLNEEADNHYIYGTNSNKTNGISGNVMIVEEASCTEPKLVIRTRMPNITFWSFGFGAHEVEYVFYVPTGSVARNR